MAYSVIGMAFLPGNYTNTLIVFEYTRLWRILIVQLHESISPVVYVECVIFNWLYPSLLKNAVWNGCSMHYGKAVVPPYQVLQVKPFSPLNRRQGGRGRTIETWPSQIWPSQLSGSYLQIIDRRSINIDQRGLQDHWCRARCKHLILSTSTSKLSN